MHKAKSSVIKRKPIPLRKADKRFSLFIRNRDGRCMHPIGCPVSDKNKLQCSHYIGRTTKSTRFDPDNCIALCWLHHYKSKDYGFEYQKQSEEVHGFDGQYTLFMKKRLGKQKFDMLIERSKLSIKQDAAILSFMEMST